MLLSRKASLAEKLCGEQCWHQCRQQTLSRAATLPRDPSRWRRSEEGRGIVTCEAASSSLCPQESFTQESALLPIYAVHEFEQTPGDSEGQGSLACCSPWGCRVRHDWVTEQEPFSPSPLEPQTLALWRFLPAGLANTETLRTIPPQAVQRSDVTSAVIPGEPVRMCRRQTVVSTGLLSAQSCCSEDQLIQYLQL